MDNNISGYKEELEYEIFKLKSELADLGWKERNDKVYYKLNDTGYIYLYFKEWSIKIVQSVGKPGFRYFVKPKEWNLFLGKVDNIEDFKKLSEQLGV